MTKSIHTEEFRVPPGENVKLKEWPTKVKPFFKSKKHYHKRLDEGVEELQLAVAAIQSLVAEVTGEQPFDKGIRFSATRRWRLRWASFARTCAVAPETQTATPVCTTFLLAPIAARRPVSPTAV